MGRTISSNLNTILTAVDRKIDWTLDINFPDSTNLKFATSPLSIAKGDYTNDLESVREIRQILQGPTDRVGVAIQNKDRIIGQHVDDNLDLWRKAEAVIGRYYVGGTGMSVTDWIEMFRGAVQIPLANDLQVTFDVITDTVSPGQIVCNRNLGPSCPFKYKDSATCADTSGATDCNHYLKSKSGCDGKPNSEHYGGTEHRYPPTPNVPGTSGNPGGGGSGGGPVCPRKDQFVQVRQGNIFGPLPADLLKRHHWLLNPITGTYHKVKSAEIVKNQPIWCVKTANGAVGYSSFSHPVLSFREHLGERVDKLKSDDPVLTLASVILDEDFLTVSHDTGELGDVVRIELEDGHIYCYSAHPGGPYIVCHNVKPLE